MTPLRVCWRELQTHAHDHGRGTRTTQVLRLEDVWMRVRRVQQPNQGESTTRARVLDLPHSESSKCKPAPAPMISRTSIEDMDSLGLCIGGNGEVATAGLGLPPQEEDETMLVLLWLDTLMTDSRWLLEVTRYLLDCRKRLAVWRSLISALC